MTERDVNVKILGHSSIMYKWYKHKYNILSCDGVVKNQTNIIYDIQFYVSSNIARVYLS